MTTRKKNRFPPGWDEQRVRHVLEHYEGQSEEEAVAEDEAALERTSGSLVDSHEDRSRRAPRETKNGAP